MPSDEALERFDRLREVGAMYGQTASAFLAKFQSIAASLKPDERIKLVIYAYESSMELLKAVISDPQANKVCSLVWRYDGKQDVNSVIPLLNNCPELASLEVYFKHHSAFDFVSSMLECPSNKLKVLLMPRYIGGDSARFFVALGQSQVAALNLPTGSSPEFTQGLHEYLARDLLVRLKVGTDHRRVPSEMMMSLVDCTRLAKLELIECEFSQPTVFTLPKSIAKLELKNCTFVGDFDWSFLADSNVRELDFLYVRDVDGRQLGGALAVHLRAKGLGRLRFSTVSFTNETLAAVGVELGRTKILDLGYSDLNDASIELIALALKSPNNEMKELVLPFGGNTVSSIENLLMPALKHPNCNLAELSFRTFEPEHKEAARRVSSTFRKRLALFVLLQGRQVRRLYCPLRRLPVEMLRLVGMVLL